MSQFLKLIHSTFPKFSLLGEMVNNPNTAFLIITPTATASKVVSIWAAFFVLGMFFLGDLFTGILASYFEWKKSEKKDRWFFGKGEGFSSDKFKKMFIKILIYCGAPLALVKFQ